MKTVKEFDAHGNPIKEGFYVGEHYKEIFYVFKNKGDIFWQCESWGGVNDIHDLSTFERIDNPRTLAKRLIAKRTAVSLDDAKFIERKLKELRNPPKKREYDWTGGKDRGYNGAGYTGFDEYYLIPTW